MPSTPSAEQLRGLQRSLFDAMVQRDAAALDRLADDGLTYVHSTGRIENKQEFMDVVLNKTVFTSIDGNVVVSREHPGIGVLTSKTVQYAEGKPPNSLLQVQVWAETPKGWRLIARHSTKVPQ